MPQPNIRSYAYAREQQRLLRLNQMQVADLATTVEALPITSEGAELSAPNSLRGLTLELKTGVDIVSARLVAIVGGALQYYQPRQKNHAHALIGMSITSAVAGGAVRIQTRGGIFLDSMSLIPDSVYLAGPNGELSLSPADDWAFVQVMGRAVDKNTLFFSPRFPIFTNG